MENQLIPIPSHPSESDQLPDTTLTLSNTELEQTSWTLFSILLSIGHPVSPTDLSSHSTYIKPSPSPEFIISVCSLPHSPLSLTPEGLVTVSSPVCTALHRFLLNEISLPMEETEETAMTKRRRVECGGKRECGDVDVDVVCTRKRRRLSRNCYVKADRADMRIPFISPNARAEVYIEVHDTIRSVIMNMGMMGMSNVERMLSLIKFVSGKLGSVVNGESEGEGEKEVSTVLRVNEFGSKSGFGSSMFTGLQVQFQSLSNLNASSLVRIEGVNDERCLLSNGPSAAPEQADGINKVLSLVKAWIHNDSFKANNNSNKRQRFTEVREDGCNSDSENHKDNREDLSHNKASCEEVGEQNIVPPTDAGNLCTNEAQIDGLQDKEKPICGRAEEQGRSLLGEQDHENLLICKDMTYKDDCTVKNNTTAELDVMSVTREPISVDQKQLADSTEILEAIAKDTSSPLQGVSIKTKRDDAGFLTEQKYGKKDKRSIYTKRKLDPTCEQMMRASRRENTKEIEEKAPAPAISVKGTSEPKEVPVFESYTVVEEEGSGGYGTVYKTRRKKDGTMFAVKYPHKNANRQHVYNEVKMLERFGGKNFVIKYEGSFKSGSSHCLVLEHVAHDRPEVLKREIDEFQLRWYGYCLFRALASLHKQGVVHRDVKPGNFLFSRKASKGYLIDFNLATDMHQKLGYTGKSKPHNDASSKLVPPPHPEFLPPTRNKYTSSRALAAETQSKMPLFPKNLKKKKDHKDLNMHGVMKSQGADGSGITSAKDATSAKIPSGERLREPIPCCRRPELLNLAQEALQSPPDHEATITTNTTVSKRKRVAAPPVNLDNKFMYLTPMPLQSTGVSLLKNKGDGKQRKEGPCVGTKGFRAPEVLLRSMYQGPKVDIWSAGVTLLYFIIGRSPFIGDPELNIKEIAKLRGSEDLWEVAKLHDRESAFPPDLFQVQSLPSTKLQEWCKHNTRRSDFSEVFSNSLIDLVDKCLTVNPRQRISAEEALRHDFFVPCFNELEKHRLNRQRLAHSKSQSVNCQTSSMKNIS